MAGLKPVPVVVQAAHGPYDGAGPGPQPGGVIDGQGLTEGGPDLAGRTIQATVRSSDGSPMLAPSKSMTAARRPSRVMRLPGMRSEWIQVSAPSQSGRASAWSHRAAAASVSAPGRGRR